MSQTNVLRKPADAQVRQVTPGQNFGNRPRLSLDNTASDQRRSFLYFAGIPPAGAGIVTATLDVYIQGSWAGGPHTITCQRLTERWREDKIDWNNQPASSATNQTTQAVTGGTDKQKVTFTVTQIVRDMLSAGQPFGFRLSLNTNGVKNLYSVEANDKDLRPVLTVVWSTLPAEPTDLHPGGAALVNIEKPVLSWSYTDPDGDDQGQFRVMVDDTSNMSSPVLDTGWVVSSEQSLDLALTALPAVADGATRYWTVQCRDTDGNDSPVSDIQSWTRDVKGSLALTSPGATTETMRPTISWTLTGETQGAYTYELDEAKGNGWVNRTPGPGQRIQLGTSNSFKLPAGLIRYKDRNYRLRLTVWDNKVERVDTPGDPRAYTLSHTFQHIDPVTNPGSPSSLVAAQSGPGVLLTWARGTVPTYWGLKVDGKFVFDDTDGVDLSTGGTNYAYTYYGAKPGVQHTYEVVAIMLVSGDDKPSKSNPTVNFTSQPWGIWLVDEQESPIVAIRLDDQEDQDLEMAEESTWFYAIGRQSPILITDTLRGYEGSVSGGIYDRVTHDALEAMKGRAVDGRRVQLVMGGLSIPVQIGKISIVDHPQVRNVWFANIEVAQVGDFPVELP